MKIESYLEKLEGNSKRHVLLIMTPKDEYPNQFSYDEYFNLEESILDKPKSYVGIYDKNQDEIMQYVVFRLFLKPMICDKYRLSNRTITKVKRIKKEEIVSFFVAKSFYDTVPSGEKTQDEAIDYGITKGEEFLKEFPLDKFEYASVALDKDSDEANTLISLDFTNKNDKYYFDYVYVC
ncbi:hypothetical protein K8O96_12055 [Clostridium sporogenes]|uniref:Uncharacterized protein n=1 Tax=Clostridium botulinum TaxID=1491 RepID=A0A6M0SWF0_CLOBO|nr:hypothetical protein [Clostridium sporogenes]NFA59473.1 hypothetical protein [Clostridium botulinum]NFI74657.1 hypothetical protein [Clostridium sporogenes]NFL71208.1 hypothetical protein [Clostridium sporogenes]NFM25371.1 hypothetical protein [Clostridium sporogenes]NFP62481.1 hypothetical protein [Clostridium sporogenes]